MLSQAANKLSRSITFPLEVALNKLFHNKVPIEVGYLSCKDLMKIKHNDPQRYKRMMPLHMSAYEDMNLSTPNVENYIFPGVIAQQKEPPLTFKSRIETWNIEKTNCELK